VESYCKLKRNESILQKSQLVYELTDNSL